MRRARATLRPAWTVAVRVRPSPRSDRPGAHGTPRCFPAPRRGPRPRRLGRSACSPTCPQLLRAGGLPRGQSEQGDSRLVCCGDVEADGRPVELLMLRERRRQPLGGAGRPGAALPRGTRVLVADGAAAPPRVVDAGAGAGARVLDVEAPWPVRELLERHGLPPLPPYIARHDAPKPEDRERYQTVYARDEGSVAAPDRRAALHARRCIAAARRARRRASLAHSTRRAGDVPTRCRVDRGGGPYAWIAEEVEIPEATADAVNRAHGRRDGGSSRSGTTTTRALEWASDGGRSGAGWPWRADLYHLPRILVPGDRRA